jgi:outer membrane protein OmpA-like peptidoglycan-associated protein/tetratricopeptide (TPR) repeat protein
MFLLAMGTLRAQLTPEQVKANAKAEKFNLRVALGHLAYQEYRKAVPYLEEANKLNPENIMTCFQLSVSLYEIGRRKRALELMELVVKSNPELDSRVPLLYARMLHSNQRYEEAIIRYREIAAKLKPTDDLQKKLALYVNQCINGIRYQTDKADATLQNLGPTINTEYPEYAPVISSDESILLFTSRRPGNFGTLDAKGQYFEDIYLSENGVAGAGWKPCKNLGEGINSNGNDACVSLSADGQTIFLFSQENQGKLYSARFDGNQIGNLTAFGPSVNTRHYEPSICVSADRKVYIFSSDKPGGLGGLDLYYLYRKPDGTFTPPMNMGPTINTAQDEDSPFLHPDGVTLYFASRGHTSMGGYDIFRTKWKVDGGALAPIENLGSPVNTPDEEPYFVLSASGEHGYISSSRDEGMGDYDLYRVSFKRSSVAPVALQQEVRPTLDLNLGQINTVLPSLPVTLIKGTVKDAVTLQPLASDIIVVDNAKGDTVSELNSNASNGKYIVTLPAGRNYGLRVLASGYLFYSENFDVRDTTAYQEVVRDILLQPIKAGNRIVLRNIFFDFDKAELRPESKSELEQVLALMNLKPTLRVRISGHTDDKGSDAYNQVLSENRARSVLKWLLEHNVQINRMGAVGEGEKRPIDTNDTDIGRRNNRRFEVEILGE